MSNLFGNGIKNSVFGNNTARSIAEDVSSFINADPVWFLYARLDRRFPCLNCFDFEEDSPKKRCPICLGTGFNLILEKMPTRPVIRPVVSGAQSTTPGFLNNYPIIIYTDYKHIPNDHDLFFEVEWDTSVADIPTYGKAVRLLHSYEVQMVATFRESANSYFGSGCETYDFDQSFLENSLLVHPTL